MKYHLLTKIAIDIIASLILLFLFFFPLCLVALIIKISSPGPVFYKQDRLGRYTKKFTLLKFRSMTVDPNRNIAQTHIDDPGVTTFGKFIRRYKIDELPQLINVLKGEMSFVGPRPCLLITEHQMPDWARQRFSCRPGLTGLAQVNGNINLSWEQRWHFDIQYASNISLISDLKIILKTFFVIVQGEEKFLKLQ